MVYTGFLIVGESYAFLRHYRSSKSVFLKIMWINSFPFLRGTYVVRFPDLDYLTPLRKELNIITSRLRYQASGLVELLVISSALHYPRAQASRVM